MKTNINEYSKNYCPLFFKGLNTFIHGNNSYSLCCSSDSLGESEIIDFNSDQQLNTIRNTYQDTKIKGCQGCWQSEQDGGTSRRQLELEWLMQNPEIDETSTELLCLDYNVGNTCNAACIMCGADASSMWQAELGIKNKIVSTKDKNRDLNLSKLRRIYLVGGEPFLIKDTKNILLDIKQQQGTLANLEVECQTNGSNFKNNQIISLLEECKKVTIKISMDAVDQAYEYIRYPLKWKTIDENFQFLLQNYNFEVEVGATVGIHNIDCLPQFYSWFETQKQNFNLSSRVFGINPVYGAFSFNNVTSKIKQKWLDKLSKYSEHTWANNAKVMITNSTSASDNTVWLNFLERIDRRRNLSWQHSLPELADIVKNTGH